MLLLLIPILLFFPIIFETDSHYDMNRRKFGFAIYAYKFLKVFGGYVATYSGGLALHISDKKAILIPYSQIDSERKRFSFMRSFKIRSFVLTTETGAEYILPVALIHTILRTFFFIKGGKKEKVENNLWLTDGDVLRVSLNCVVSFNLLILLGSFLKFIKEKMKQIWQKKIKK